MELFNLRLTPIQRKINDHFNSSKWTFDTMDSLVTYQKNEKGELRYNYSKRDAELATFLTEQEIEEFKKSRDGFLRNLIWTKLSPIQQKVYEYFGKKEYWTSARIKELTGDKLFAEFNKIGIPKEKTDEMQVALPFLKIKIYRLKYTKESFKNT